MLYVVYVVVVQICVICDGLLFLNMSVTEDVSWLFIFMMMFNSSNPNSKDQVLCLPWFAFSFLFTFS